MSSYAKVAWQGQPLPRGRHKLEPEEVRESQRRRISRAMLEVVAEHGYEATTVSQVVPKPGEYVVVVSLRARKQAEREALRTSERNCPEAAPGVTPASSARQPWG